MIAHNLLNTDALLMLACGLNFYNYSYKMADGEISWRDFLEKEKSKLYSCPVSETDTEPFYFMVRGIWFIALKGFVSLTIYSGFSEIVNRCYNYTSLKMCSSFFGELQNLTFPSLDVMKVMF